MDDNSHATRRVLEIWVDATKNRIAKVTKTPLEDGSVESSLEVMSEGNISRICVTSQESFFSDSVMKDAGWSKSDH